tara:strand:- start:45373 stop:46152 length:780 start_codon:yes stop_codon:yes gene_type:complete
MKKNYLLLLFVFSLTIVASAQQTLYSDDFETGYTNDADLAGVNGWQVFGTTPIVKSVQNAGAGFNGSDWYIEISTGAFQQIQKVYELVSGETYEFKIQAIRTNGFNGELKVQAFKLGGTTTLITESPAAITNDAYQEKSITFVADESINHGFRITQNFGTSFMQIDDVEITCTSCPVLSVNEKNGFEFAMYPNPVTDVIHFNTKERLASARIYDLLGKEVLQVLNPSESINISTLTNGLYVLKLESKNGAIVTRKIVKE